MFITKMLVRCDFCKTEIEHESKSRWGDEAPAGWFSFGRVTMCPACKRSKTVADMTALNAQLGQEMKEAREKRELEEGDE